MKLILTRHGETDKNVQGLVYGNLPSKLTENGKKQAEELAVMLDSYKIDEIFCSDLDRCVETAKPIIALHPGSADFIQSSIKRTISRQLDRYEDHRRRLA